MNEQFSVFIDGEATRDEADSAISALLRDDDLKATWTRQHWLRTTLRAHNGEIAVPIDTDFSSRVMAAIATDDQPTSVAPARVVSMPRRAAGSRRRRWRNMAGLAAVASATGFALLVSSPLRQDVPDGNRSGVVVAPAASSASTATVATQQASAGGGLDADLMGKATMASTAQPARATARRVASTGHNDTAADHWSVSDPEIADELNGYLVEHNGMARGYGLSGATPAFVRVATYGQESTQ